MINANKHGMSELPHELPNDLENQEISRKSQNFIQLQPSAHSFPPKMKILSILAKNN